MLFFSERPYIPFGQGAQKGECAGFQAWLHVTELGEGGNRETKGRGGRIDPLHCKIAFVFPSFSSKIEISHPSRIFNPHLRHAMNIGRQITPFLFQSSGNQI